MRLILFLSCGILLLGTAIQTAYPAGKTDTPVALQLLAHEARDNNASAQLLYGLAYLEGRNGLKVDAKKAVYWLRRSARMGNAYAQLMLGKSFAQGNGVTKDMTHAVKWWHESARKGYPEAQYLLGKAMLQGQGIKKNPTRAIYWLTKAAEQNNKDAQYLLGKMYYKGYAITKDKTIAQTWLSRAAEQGNPDALNLLNILEDSVNFTMKVYKESSTVLINRANNGDAQAQYELGIRYESGAWDVNQDNSKALQWITRAAKNGNRIAMKTLAGIYRHGDLGLPVDLHKAADWDKKATPIHQH